MPGAAGARPPPASHPGCGHAVACRDNPQMAHEPQSPGIARTVVVDLVVAVIIFALGAIVAWDSYRLGTLICISSAVVFVQSMTQFRESTEMFVQREQLKQVMIILLPSTVYVLGI